MDVVLIAGLWLDASAWDAVVPELAALGHRAVPVTLPGQGNGDASATLDDQVGAVIAAADACAEPCLVVGHSAASTLAYLAADRRPEKVTKVVMIGGFPTTDGGAYAAFFEPVDGVMAFPGWGPFEGPDSADLSDELKASVEAAAIPVPEAVASGIVHYTNDARHDLTPVVLICPEFSPEDALAWIEAGDIPELADTADLELANIDSGHWPMFTAPAVLAGLIAGATD